MKYKDLRNKLLERPGVRSAYERRFHAGVPGSLRAEPFFLLPESDDDLSDLIFVLLQRASALGTALPTPVANELARIVRWANCYYSNLIEGNEFHHRDTERLRINEVDSDTIPPGSRNEAIAHLELQARIDTDHDLAAWPASSTYVRWLHEELYSRLPDHLLRATDSRTKARTPISPGAYRTRNIVIGRHHPPDPDALADTMARFDEAYNSDRLNKNQLLLSAAAAHHRLLWIHPFIDGNGRVARLMSHALLLRLGTRSTLWSISRGLYLRVNDYWEGLAHADSHRMGDLDGRGALSLAALKDFCRFFLTICIEQVEFMQKLIEPTTILRHIETYTTHEIAAGTLPTNTFEVLREAFYKGELQRRRIPELLRFHGSRAHDAISVLVEKGLLVTTSPTGSVALGFPSYVWNYWLPSLCP